MAAFCVDKRGGDRRAFAFIPLRKRSGQKRSRDAEPLCGVAPNRAEPRRNTERLDALDNNAHVHRMAKAADPAQKIYSAAVVLDPLNECPIDFEAGSRQFCEIT